MAVTAFKVKKTAADDRWEVLFLGWLVSSQAFGNYVISTFKVIFGYLDRLFNFDYNSRKWHWPLSPIPI
jgi:hypothetical protein